MPGPYVDRVEARLHRLVWKRVFGDVSRNDVVSRSCLRPGFLVAGPRGAPARAMAAMFLCVMCESQHGNMAA